VGGTTTLPSWTDAPVVHLTTVASLYVETLTHRVFRSASTITRTGSSVNTSHFATETSLAGIASSTTTLRSTLGSQTQSLSASYTTGNEQPKATPPSQRATPIVRQSHSFSAHRSVSSSEAQPPEGADQITWLSQLPSSTPPPQNTFTSASSSRSLLLHDPTHEGVIAPGQKASSTQTREEQNHVGSHTPETGYPAAIPDATSIPPSWQTDTTTFVGTGSGEAPSQRSTQFSSLLPSASTGAPVPVASNQDTDPEANGYPTLGSVSAAYSSTAAMTTYEAAQHVPEQHNPTQHTSMVNPPLEVADSSQAVGSPVAPSGTTQEASPSSFIQSSSGRPRALGKNKSALIVEVCVVLYMLCMLLVGG
jgi:hypothetical protein